MNVIRMTDLDLSGKRVLIRQDLNVPIKDGKLLAISVFRPLCQRLSMPSRRAQK